MRFQINCMRLWGCTGAGEYPVQPSEVVNARSQGVTRTNSVELFKAEVPEYNHNPLLQTSMQLESVQTYKPACWLKGYCRSAPHKVQRQHECLHKLLVKEIRKQIGSKLSAVPAKEYLTSGDVAIAVRFSTGDSSKLPDCLVFLLASVSLKPISMVLLPLVVKSSSDPSETFAHFQLAESGAIHFQTSWDLVAELLQQQKAEESVIVVDVLEHKPMFLVCIIRMETPNISSNHVWISGRRKLAWPGQESTCHVTEVWPSLRPIVLINSISFSISISILY